MKKAMFTQCGLAILSCCIAAPALSAGECPTLTAADIKHVIKRDSIGTDRSHTLAVEANMNPVDIMKNEPTANPFDTFYGMYAEKQTAVGKYGIVIGNVLGKDIDEAQHRAKKILLNVDADNTQPFTGRYDRQTGVCIYKMIHANPSIAGYPFKSSYESVVLVAFAVDDEDDGYLKQAMFKSINLKKLTQQS